MIRMVKEAGPLEGMGGLGVGVPGSVGVGVIVGVGEIVKVGEGVGEGVGVFMGDPFQSV